ncbi:ABC transporter ATP-binding protein [Streptomyces sp. 4N509B]|uniref:ABC transporter ATP-binding protein n=1 Tax=Streptomyces sp. 4N509B TaxID=3457413 RepID=UPI003FD51068
MSGPLLEAAGLTRAFGGVLAVDGVDLAVERGTTLGVIGPNGAGKSTLFHLISGHLRADGGTLRLGDRRVERLSPQARARLGVAIVFQGARVFHGMTVVENVMVGAHATTGAGFVAAALRLPRHRREERSIAARAREAVRRVGLAEWADHPAEQLPLGRQRAVQLARALCGRPRLLLLDEPASGLRAAERERLAELIEDLRSEGVTMVLVEHDVGLVGRLADRVTVLDLGRVIAEGTPEAIRADPAVVRAYLGTAPPPAHVDGPA